MNIFRGKEKNLWFFEGFGEFLVGRKWSDGKGWILGRRVLKGFGKYENVIFEGGYKRHANTVL